MSVSENIDAKSSLEIRRILLELKDTLRSKRSLSIRLANFPPYTTILNVIDVLRSLLTEMNLHIERLLLAENRLRFIPDELLVVCDDRLRALDLRSNDLHEIPSSIAAMYPNLELLDLSSNQLWNLPNSTSSLENLRVLKLNNNVFSYLPPILGELISLEKLVAHGNPLVVPSQQAIQTLEKDTNRLKAYLLSNSLLLEQNLNQQLQRVKSTNLVSTRSRSSSDTKMKTSKASRRMGLIINKNKKQEAKSDSGQKADKLADHSESNAGRQEPESHETHLIPRTSPPAISMTRLRQNTMTEINDMLQQPELSDTEYKSGAYFRRLSTLQELPSADQKRETFSMLDRLSDVSKPNDFGISKSPNPTSAASNVVRISETFLPGSFVNTNEAVIPNANSGHDNSILDLATILKVARKILFSFSEFHSSIKRLTGFCTDRKIAARTISLLHNSKSDIDNLVETMESSEEQNEGSDDLFNVVTTCVHSFKQILSYLVDNFSYYVARIDVCFIRMVYLTIFGAFNELQNAHGIINPNLKLSNPKSHGILADHSKLLLSNQNIEYLVEQNKDGYSNQAFLQRTDNNTVLDDVDEKLYESINVAITNAQVVFNELTKAMNKSAVASTNNGPQAMNPLVASKFKDLTNTCMSLMDITKRLSAKIPTVKASLAIQAKKAFWDDINVFLKAIIQTFSSVKLIMKDAPILNEVRQSMANLTKATKELTILLEASSFSIFSEAALTGSFAWSHSHTNLSHLGSLSAPVRTPLVATVGAAAAQAIMPNNDNSTFFPSLTGEASTSGSGVAPEQTNYFPGSE